MRRAAHIDGNHADVVAALRKLGAAVTSLAAVGGGVPDLLVGFHRVNVLLEVKNPAQKPSDQQLNAAQQKFHDTWPGPVFVVRTPEMAVALVVEAARPKGPEVLVPRCKCGEVYQIEVSCPRCDASNAEVAHG